MRIVALFILLLTLLLTNPACFLGKRGNSEEYSRCPKNWTYEKPYVPTAEDTLFESAWTELGYRPCYIDSALQRWHMESVPMSAAKLEAASDTVRAIHEFFRDYYTLDSQYLVPEYVVLQGSVDYAVLDSSGYASYCRFDSVPSSGDLDDVDWKELQGFRPVIKSTDVKLIYLTRDRIHTLNYFFNAENGYDPCLMPCIDRLDWSILRSKELKLAKLIPLSEQHWCIGFSYNSYPILLSIALSSDLCRAKINTMQGFSSGQYLEYMHTDSGWTPLQHKITREWIM